MTLKAQSTHRSGGPDAKRNFILQQGLCEPAAGTCPLLYSALRFQPWLVGPWVVVATILQAPFLFFTLAAVLWWSALAPQLNPFDALYNWSLARSSGITLASAPAPRRFASFWPVRLRLQLDFHLFWAGARPRLFSKGFS